MDSVFSKLYHLYLPIRNTVVYLTKTATMFFHYAPRQSSSHPSSSISTGLPGQVRSSTMTQSRRQTVQPVSTVPNVGYQPNNASQTTATQHQQALAGSQNDYMLLCSDEKGWLTTREDLNVSQMKSDRELFGAFQSRLKLRKHWTRRFASLKTVQRISFVKVSNPLCLHCDVCDQ